MLDIDAFERGRDDYKKRRPAPSPPKDDDLVSPQAQRWYGYLLEKAWQEVRAECARVILRGN